MKTIIIVFIILFNLQTLTIADDISDFEIEGISIGDSALNFFSSVKIKENTSNPPNLKNSEYTQSCFDRYGNTYDRICIAYNKKSSKKKIVSVQAQLKYNKDAMNICRKKQYEIDKEFSVIFKNLERKDWGKYPLKSIIDIDPDAHYYPITYEFVDKSRAQLACYSIQNKTSLKISVYTLEYAIKVLRK